MYRLFKPIILQEQKLNPQQIKLILEATKQLYIKHIQLMSPRSFIELSFYITASNIEITDSVEIADSNIENLSIMQKNCRNLIFSTPLIEKLSSLSPSTQCTKEIMGEVEKSLAKIDIFLSETIELFTAFNRYSTQQANTPVPMWSKVEENLCRGVTTGLIVLQKQLIHCNTVTHSCFDEENQHSNTPRF